MRDIITQSLLVNIYPTTLHEYDKVNWGKNILGLQSICSEFGHSKGFLAGKEASPTGRDADGCWLSPPQMYWRGETSINQLLRQLFLREIDRQEMTEGMRNIDSVLTLIKNRKWDQSGGGGDEGTSQRGDSYFILYEFSSRIEYYGASYLEINQHLQMHLKLSVLIQTRLNRVSWMFKNTMFHPPQSAPGKVFCHMWQKKKKKKNIPN